MRLVTSSMHHPVDTGGPPPLVDQNPRPELISSYRESHRHPAADDEGPARVGCFMKLPRLARKATAIQLSCRESDGLHTCTRVKGRTRSKQTSYHRRVPPLLDGSSHHSVITVIEVPLTLRWFNQLPIVQLTR